MQVWRWFSCAVRDVFEECRLLIGVCFVFGRWSFMWCSDGCLLSVWWLVNNCVYLLAIIVLFCIILCIYLLCIRCIARIRFSQLILI